MEHLGRNDVTRLSLYKQLADCWWIEGAEQKHADQKGGSSRGPGGRR